jgi:hypothetical protein
MIIAGGSDSFAAKPAPLTCPSAFEREMDLRRPIRFDLRPFHAVDCAVEALADDPAPPDAFVRGAYRRLHVGTYRVPCEVEGDLITIVRIDRA